MLNQKIVGACTALLFATALVNAQELQLQKLQRNIDIFSGVLEEALDFAGATGLFGLSLGGIESTYLYGQGAVLKIRTPLANRRNRISLVSLSSAMQSLRFRSNPFETLRRPVIAGRAEPATSALSLTRTEAGNFYWEMMDRVSNIDYSLVVSKAIQQASESARSLRAMGSVDESDYEIIRAEIEGLREEMQANMEQLRQVEADIRDTSDADSGVASDDSRTGLQSRLDTLAADVAPLREKALAKAAELFERSKVAEQAYAAQWQREVIEFESKLYAAMCDYSSTLRELPADESVSIILTGLGEESENNRRTDKVHVFSKADLLQCQTGDIDLATLRQRSIEYSY